MTIWDWIALSPILAMGALALGALGLDALLGVAWRGRRIGDAAWLPWIVVGGMVVPILLILNLWFGWIGDSALAETYGLEATEARQVAVYSGQVLFGSFDPRQVHALLSTADSVGDGGGLSRVNSILAAV